MISFLNTSKNQIPMDIAPFCCLLGKYFLCIAVLETLVAPLGYYAMIINFFVNVLCLTFLTDQLLVVIPTKRSIGGYVSKFLAGHCCVRAGACCCLFVILTYERSQNSSAFNCVKQCGSTPMLLLFKFKWRSESNFVAKFSFSFRISFFVQ